MDYKKAYKAVLKTATQWIKDGCTDKEKICLECVFPELRESQDEWMIARIKDALGSYHPKYSIPEVQEMIAWLDTRKDCEVEIEKAYKNADAIQYRKGFEDGVASVKQEALPNEELNEAAEAYASHVDMGTCGELVIPAFIAGAKWQERQKEQKPAECVPDSVKFDEGFKTGREIGFREGAESVKPVEWSDDFEENIRILLHDKLTWHSEDGAMSTAVLIDDKQLKDIISGIWFYVGKEVLKYPNKELNVSEWGEEDEEIINGIIRNLEYLLHNTLCAEEAKHNLENRIDFLKSLRPQPHWKPSEEQMKIFNEAVEHYSKYWDSEDIKILCSLYDELSKL